MPGPCGKPSVEKLMTKGLNIVNQPLLPWLLCVCATVSTLKLHRRSAAGASDLNRLVRAPRHLLRSAAPPHVESSRHANAPSCSKAAY